MLPKIEELLNQFMNTKDADVRKKCIFDILEYQGIDNAINDIIEFLDNLHKSKLALISLRDCLSFHKELIERES